MTTMARLPGVPREAEPVDDVPDEFEESRPVDLDDCVLCAGTGVYAVHAFGVPDRYAYVTCPTCRGTGERGAA